MAITLDGTAGLTLPGTSTAVQVGSITLGTSQTTTSGTSKDFTNIPSWTKKVTLLFQGISLSGTSNFLVQLGTGGSPTTSGYVSGSSSMGAAVASITSTAGFALQVGSTAAYAIHGSFVFYNITGNTWVGNAVGAYTGVTGTITAGGFVTLAGVLDNLRLTSINGTDTFDAGTINILYE
jgi:hypothetical protein